jgi:hypothetical protein
MHKHISIVHTGAPLLVFQAQREAKMGMDISVIP